MRKVRTNCPRDCYDGCGIIVEIRERAPHRVLGDPDHPVSRGRLCSKCAVAYNGVWQDPQARLLYPLERTGPRGSGEFRRIGWDEALEKIAGRVRQARDAAGPASILHTHYSGTLSLIGYLFPSRFFNHLGATEVDPDTICNAAGHVAWSLLFGNSTVGVDPRTAVHSTCILVWGANPSHSAPHAHEHWLRETSARIVVVDPIRTESAAAADLHLQPRPGTDAALAFALLHCLERDGRLDHAFIAAHTLGYEDIAPVIARSTPEWGESVTGVPAPDIEKAAAWYGAGPALLWCGQALQRQPTGGNVMRAVGLLPALTGNVGKPGSGFYYLNATPAMAGLDLGWLAGAALAPPGARRLSHMHLAERLAASDEFRVLFSWNTNPLASAPAQTRLREALAREDLFVVVSDVFMTDTARFADIVLPAASFLEYDDLTFSYFHLHIGAQARVCDPPGEALPNAEIFRRLARALGLVEPALFEDDQTLITHLMAQLDAGFDFTELKRRGYHPISEHVLQPWAECRFDTPSGRIEIVSEQAAALGLPRTPQPWADDPPAAGWLRLLTPASKWRLNDSYANDPHIIERSGRTVVRLNPIDAAAHGVREGQPVRLVNACGALRVLARLDDAVLPGTAVSYKGRWPQLEADGANVNALHEPRMADMGESSAVHGTLVRLEAG